MPIGGFVITVKPDDLEVVHGELNDRDACEIHGTDKQGNIVTVIETATGDEMDSLVAKLEEDSRILSVGLTYLHVEDEIDKIIRGEITPDLRKRPRA